MSKRASSLVENDLFIVERKKHQLKVLAIQILIPAICSGCKKNIQTKKTRSHVGIVQIHSYELITLSNLILFFVIALMVLTLMLVIMLMMVFM